LPEIENGELLIEDESELQAAAKALRPLILRRTKEAVLDDLPAKTEATLTIELKPKQRKHYSELLTYYQQKIRSQIDERGVGRTKFQVLEALLRLRQAACHPGLIDPDRREDPSAKFEVLLEHLEECVEAGHKALVFSQFTSLFALLRPHLDSLGMDHLYLDGKTNKRQDLVDRFQNEANPKLFLISLKAGGLGLNLTAADYVFILDPWWNPAVEAQAIDRAHRIGQTRSVFAYRLIARDTVEERIAQLQDRKRALSDAILGEDKSLIESMTREDIELLLS
jgi:SNF2 family DNA or RNA helicase